MAEKKDLKLGCLTFRIKDTDLRIELDNSCPASLSNLIRNTIGRGGDTVYSLTRAKTELDKCDIEAASKCALDVDPIACEKQVADQCKKEAGEDEEQ